MLNGIAEQVPQCLLKPCCIPRDQQITRDVFLDALLREAGVDDFHSCGTNQPQVARPSLERNAGTQFDLALDIDLETGVTFTGPSITELAARSR